MSKSTAILARPTSLSDLRIPRRKFMTGAAAAGMALGSVLGRAYTQITSSSDYSLRIAPLRLELAPGKVIDTFAYNDSVPGPVLRLREGRPVSIDIRNDTDIDDIIHWHGLYVPSVADGAMEEGSPMVERGGTQRYSFLAKPTGTRWYHSHNPAETDLSRSLYGGLYGFMIVEPTGDPGRYDREVLLAAHHWEGSWAVCRTSAGDHRQTTASRCSTNPHRSTTRCSVMASPSGFVRVNAFCFGYSMPAQLKTLLSLYPATALRSSRLMEIRCPHNAPSTHCLLPRRNGSMRSWR